MSGQEVTMAEQICFITSFPFFILSLVYPLFPLPLFVASLSVSTFSLVFVPHSPTFLSTPCLVVCLTRFSNGVCGYMHLSVMVNVAVTIQGNNKSDLGAQSIFPPWLLPSHCM